MKINLKKRRLMKRLESLGHGQLHEDRGKMEDLLVEYIGDEEIAEAVADLKEELLNY